MPVVAKNTAIGATGCASAEDGHARNEMIARLFLDRVYLESRWSPVRECIVPSIDIDSREAKTSFVGFNSCSAVPTLFRNGSRPIYQILGNYFFVVIWLNFSSSLCVRINASNVP